MISAVLSPHNPEPLPENLSELASAVLFHRADLGIAVDPDVDRLALVCEDGEMFGEEYTWWPWRIIFTAKTGSDGLQPVLYPGLERRYPQTQWAVLLFRQLARSTWWKK